MTEHVCSLGCKKGRIFNRRLRIFEPCPECTGVKRMAEIRSEESTVLETHLLIPKDYQNGRPIDRDLLRLPAISARYTPESIERVSELMERINKDIYNQQVLKLSCYIHTSNEVDARQFVFGAQQLAFERGLGVSPYVSLNMLYGIQRSWEYGKLTSQEQDAMKVQDMNPDMRAAYDGNRFIVQTGVTYYDFMSADVCFLEATASTTEKGWNVLADIASERARMNLPVYVVGYWPSKAGGTNTRGLRYLLQPEGARPRLDLLTSYELLSKRAAGNQGSSPGLALRGPEPLSRVPSTASPVRAGVSSGAFLGT